MKGQLNTNVSEIEVIWSDSVFPLNSKDYLLINPFRAELLYRKNADENVKITTCASTDMKEN